MLDSKIVVLFCVAITISNSYAHFRIGKRSKFADRSSRQITSTKISDIIGLVQRMGDSDKLCRQFISISSKISNGKFSSGIQDRIQNDFGSKQQRLSVAKYKAVAQLVEDFCVQKALEGVIADEVNEGLEQEDETEIYRKQY